MVSFQVIVCPRSKGVVVVPFAGMQLSFDPIGCLIVCQVCTQISTPLNVGKKFVYLSISDVNLT